MTHEEFKYWLSGFLLLTDELYLDSHQITIIKNHADLVKAISGELEECIKNFILTLEKLGSKDSLIPILAVKQCASSVNCLLEL